MAAASASRRIGRIFQHGAGGYWGNEPGRRPIDRASWYLLSINRWNVHALWNGFALVVRAVSALRQGDLIVPHDIIGNGRQQMLNAVQPGALLVDGLDDPPRSLRNARAFKHDLLCLGIGLPTPPRLNVHRTKFPLLERIVDAHQEAELLLLVRD